MRDRFDFNFVADPGIARDEGNARVELIYSCHTVCQNQSVRTLSFISANASEDVTDVKTAKGGYEVRVVLVRYFSLAPMYVLLMSFSSSWPPDGCYSFVYLGF